MLQVDIPGPAVYRPGQPGLDHAPLRHAPLPAAGAGPSQHHLRRRAVRGGGGGGGGRGGDCGGCRGRVQSAGVQVPPSVPPPGVLRHAACPGSCSWRRSCCTGRAPRPSSPWASRCWTRPPPPPPRRSTSGCCRHSSSSGPRLATSSVGAASVTSPDPGVQEAACCGCTRTWCRPPCPASARCPPCGWAPGGRASSAPSSGPRS